MKLLRSITLLGLIIFCISCNVDNSKYVMIETEYGNMKAILYDSTPKHRDNFYKLAKEGFYDDLLFHRVIKGFMVQGGDPESKGAAPGKSLGSGGPGYRIDAEIGAVHYKGALAAARTGGASNPQKMSSGSQFYIVQGRAVTAANLENLAKNKGIEYTPAQIQRYEEVGGTPNLDAEYTVFGEVIEGLDVIDKIAAVQTGARDRPAQDVKMYVKAL